MRVLIVDDMADIRFSVREGLKAIDQDYDIIEAKTAEEGMEKIPEFKPDVIIMDIMLPGMDGLDATMLIKNDPSLQHIPVIVLTAKTDKLTKGMSNVAADAFVEKPFDIEVLDQTIKNLLK
jgi:CheY-like chemotaxis protein